jgi:hypothetical protein
MLFQPRAAATVFISVLTLTNMLTLAASEEGYHDWLNSVHSSEVLQY